jgi:hypothetical protein
MKVEIEKAQYERLLAAQKTLTDFLEKLDILAYGTEDHSDDPDYLGEEDFTSEAIAELVMEHFNLNY